MQSFFDKPSAENAAIPKPVVTQSPAPQPLQRLRLPGITVQPGFRFRSGQVRFLKKLASAFDAGEFNHLGVFVPGYGKTITALASFVIAHAMGVAQKLVVFVPRGNLRDQYADKKEMGHLFQSIGAPRFSFAVADSDKVFLKNLNTQIIITTYQYASGANGAQALRQYCEHAPCMFVFDEVHHLADDGTWATVISTFRSSSSIALSGTPVRSDSKSLYGVPVEKGKEGEGFYKALHEVTLKDAHSEGKILKRVEAHVVDYHLTMLREDTGERVELTLSELATIATEKKDIDAYLARRHLRFHDVYLETLLDPAFQQFRERREMLDDLRRAAGMETGGRNHQMLVIAMSNRHAAAMLEFIRMRYPGVRAERIGQDVPAGERKKHLEAYRNGALDVMVQVDMIGEGTDIKPISIIVKADLVRAWSKTLQQVFRGMRYFDGFPEEANLCDIYSADDSQVVATLAWITSEQRFGMKMKDDFFNQERDVPRGEAIPSVWRLEDVEHSDLQTHVLELFPELAKGEQPELMDDDYVIDMGAKEEKLRSDCAAMAARLSFILEARGETIEPKQIHWIAVKKFAKSQGELSLAELERKKQWLERCLMSRKIVE